MNIKRPKRTQWGVVGSITGFGRDKNVKLSGTGKTMYLCLPLVTMDHFRSTLDPVFLKFGLKGLWESPTFERTVFPCFPFENRIWRDSNLFSSLISALKNNVCFLLFANCMLQYSQISFLRKSSFPVVFPLKTGFGGFRSYFLVLFPLWKTPLVFYCSHWNIFRFP